VADEIKSAEEARELPDGTWVIDAEEHPWCMLDTHVGFPQRMAGYKRSLTNLDNLAYPLSLGEFEGECEHSWGTRELGQCVRCGVRVAEPCRLFFDAGGMEIFRLAAVMNARAEVDTMGAER
jgi:hypothetical protein